jgi:hypothetical protein
MRRKSAPQAKAEVPTVSLGLPGLEHSYGNIHEEMHPRLRGGQAMRIYQEMSENSAVLAGALYSIKSHLRRVKWRWEPADESEAAEVEADFVRSCANDMERSWSDVMNDLFTMLEYGFAPAETVYKIRRGPASTSPRFRSRYDDGRVGWRLIDLRAQTSITRWDIDDGTGEIKGCWQQPPNSTGEIYIPMSRMVLFRTSTYKNNPEGRSILRGAYRSWHFAKRLEETEAVGLVRSLVNLPKMEIPARFMSPNATNEEKAVRAQFQKMVSLISKDQLSGLVLPASTDDQGKPTGYKFELVGAAGAQMPVDPVIRRYDARMLMTLAAEFLLLGTEKQGSFALGAEKSSNFVQSLEYYVDIIEDTVNQVLIPRLMLANNVPEALWPRLCHDPIASVSVTALGQFMSQAAGFLTPSLKTENALRESVNLPEIDEDTYEEAKEAAAEAAKPTAPNTGGPAPASET